MYYEKICSIQEVDLTLPSKSKHHINKSKHCNKMKRLLFITILALCCGLTTWAQNNPVSNHTCGGGNHEIGPNFGYVRAGISLSYDDCSQTIIVNGITDNSSYLVTITSATTLEEWYDEVSGPANVIDVSFLEEGRYRITLESNEGAIYTFTLNITGNSTTVFDGSLTPRGGGENWSNVFSRPTSTY